MNDALTLQQILDSCADEKVKRFVQTQYDINLKECVENYNRCFRIFWSGNLAYFGVDETPLSEKLGEYFMRVQYEENHEESGHPYRKQYAS